MKQYMKKESSSCNRAFIIFLMEMSRHVGLKEAESIKNVTISKMPGTNSWEVTVSTTRSRYKSIISSLPNKLLRDGNGLLRGRGNMRLVTSPSRGESNDNDLTHTTTDAGYEPFHIGEQAICFQSDTTDLSAAKLACLCSIGGTILAYRRKNVWTNNLTGLSR